MVESFTPRVGAATPDSKVGEDVVGHLSFGDKASRMIATRERQIAPRSGNDLNNLWLNGIITLGKSETRVHRI